MVVMVEKRPVGCGSRGGDPNGRKWKGRGGMNELVGKGLWKKAKS